MANTSKPKEIDITKTGPLGFRQLQRMNDISSPAMSDTSSLLEGLGINDDSFQSLYDPMAHAQQDVMSPLAGTKTRTGGGDFWGNSFFDSPSATQEQFVNLSDIRAENQPWYSKLVNGIGKAGVLAATTAAELGGLIYGLGQGVYNAATFDSENDIEGEGNRAGAFLHGLWDNPITRTLQAINEASEEYMPNYYTQDEQENPFGNIFTANFLGDKILKNLGFMVGAFYGGIPMAKGIGKLGTTAVKNARNEYQALRSGMAAGIRDAKATAAGDVNEFNRLLEARHLTEAERGERLREGLEKINKIANTTRATTQVIGALGSAINEGAIEAINNSKDWAEAKTREENDNYQQKLAAIENTYGGTEMEVALKIQAAEDHEKKLAEIEKGRATMGNADLLMNIPILTYSNMLQLGKLYTRGFDSTRRRMGSLWNGHRLSGSAAEGTLKSDKTWKGAVARGLRNSLSEGSEEYLQRSASDAAGNEVMDSIDRYVNSGKSEDSKIGVDNYIAGFAKAVADNAGNPEAWEEFMIGALSSMVGMPVFGSQTKNAYMKLGPVGFAGGMVGSYKDYMAEKKHESDVANYINGRVKDPKFRALYDYLRKSEDYEQALMTALENNDKEEYKNLEAEKLFEDINAFASAGHLEEFKQLIGFNEDYDAAELADIVKNTRRPVTAAQQKQIDTERLRDIDIQLSQMGSSSLEEDTSALDNELNSLRKEISTQNRLLRRANDDTSKHNISQELTRLNQRYNELNKQRQGIIDKNMQAAAVRKQKEELEKERTAINTRLAGEYKDRDEGEFVQMVNGVPIGMDTIPDVDDEGNPIAGTEGNEMRRILDRNRQKLLKGINDYLRIRDNIDVETDGRLEDNEISLLTKMKMQILDKDARSLEMADDLADGLRPVQDIQKKAKERADRAVEKAKNAHTVALKLLNDAKANKDISPDTIAELEKDVVKAENDLKTAEKGARAMDNAISLLGMLVDPRRTTRRERKALDRGYGKDEDGDTYSDIYDSSERNINSDEAQSLLSNPINAIALSEIVNMEGNNLSDAEKQKYINEIWSLSSLAHDKKAYNDQLRKFMKDPTLINQAMSDANMRMTQKEIDNKSDELALRIRRAKDMVELDGIMRGSQIAPEVAQQALQKAKQDGDDNFKTWVSDYEKARGFFDAFNSKVGKYPGWLQEAIANNASVAWNDALMDNSDESKYDKFISLLNEYADEIEKAGDKEQAKAIKDAVKELSDAANATTTNSSSSVRTPSSSSSSSSSTGSSANGTTGTGSSGSAGSTRAVPKSKVLKQIDYKIGMKLRNGQIISSIDELEEVKTTVENYNKQNPDDQITDDYIKQRVEELSNETLNDDEGAKDSGSTLSEEDYKNEKSSKMRGHLRITFKGDGVTEYKVYEGDKGAVLLESKEDYSRSEIAEAIHQILKDTHAYDFLSHNYLGYLQQSLAAGESITVHLLRSKNDKVGNKVFLAIEWTPAVARAIKRTGFGTDSEVTIPDTTIEAVDKDGNSKKYQIIGDLSILDEDSGMDPGITRAFNEVVDAVNEEVNPILESTDAQWAVSSLTSEVDTIYTGRLVKKDNMSDSADRKIGLDELVTTSAEWNGEEDLQFGVVTNGKVDHEDSEILEEPNPAWVQKNPGAILLFVPKPDGRLYPVRCTRRTVAEWYKDADGEAMLDKVLKGTLDNDYLQEVVDTLRKLMSPDTSYGDRVNAKMSLKKYFVLGSGGKKVSIHFEGDVVRVSFDESSHRKHTITVDKNNIDGAVKEFFELLRKEDIPFSIPLPTGSDISGKSIISSGIFKIGLKDFYNFNPSFTIAPIDRNGNRVQPEVPESEREHFAGSTRTRPNSYVLNLGAGDVLYHQDTSAATPTFYKSKVDKSGNPTGAVEKVTDSQELLLVPNAMAIIQEGQGEEAMPIMLNALMPGPSFKDRKDTFKEILADSWDKVYIIRTPDGVWYFDNRSSSHSKAKLFKQGTPLAEALKKEFEEDVKRHDDEVTKKLMEGGSKPKPTPTGSTGAPAGNAAGTTNSSASKIADIVTKLKEATQTQPRSKNADWSSVIKDLQAIKVSNATTLDELDNQIYNVFNKYDVGKYWNNLDSYRDSMGISRPTLRAAILSQLTGNAGTTVGTQTGGSPAGKTAGTTASGSGSTGGQTGKVLVGKDLKSFKSDAPRVVQLLKDRKTEKALDDYINTIYKDLQTLEAMGVSVLGDDVIEKINELVNWQGSIKKRNATWQEFVEKKKC